MNAYPPIAPNSGGRKMRRSRDTTTVSSEGKVRAAFDLYTVQGDAAGALTILLRNQQEKRQMNAGDGNKVDNSKGTVSFASKYNCMLLTQIAPNSKKKSLSQDQIQSKEILLNKLDELDSAFQRANNEKQNNSRSFSSARKQLRNELILSYNRMLVLHASGDINLCAQLCTDKLNDMINQHRDTKNVAKIPDDVSAVAARIGFLLLECVLSMAVGRHGGLTRITSLLGSPSVDTILDWLESLPAINSSSNGNVQSEIQNNQTNDPQLKFLLNLYKSRLAIADLDDENGNHVEAHLRSARKEMKTAMEVFQHKLRPFVGAETASVVSSANSEENMSLNGNFNRQDIQSTAQSSSVLQKLNQSALSLKAHLEQLKGNTKKSLILCTEAAGAEESTFLNPGYDAIHSNNLAVIYETSNKRQLALHSIARALRASSLPSETFSGSDEKDNEAEGNRSSFLYPDGTIRPNMTLAILHNAAICSLRARNYIAAYECIATCFTKSKIFFNRSLSLIFMAECCIGLWTDNRNTARLKNPNPIHFNRETQGIIMDNTVLNDDCCCEFEEIDFAVGSKDDMDLVKRNPLVRARASLIHALQNKDSLTAGTVISAQLSLAYVFLAFGECKGALEMAKSVLSAPPLSQDADEGSSCLRKIQLAMAQMFAAESCTLLGDLVSAMKYIVVDGKDDVLDRLASDLSGVTLEIAASNDKAKQRLAKAQAMVRSSAGAITAAMGNSQAAKQLANSANAMVNVYSANRERSSARRALLYTLLRDGHQTSALNLLMTFRP